MFLNVDSLEELEASADYFLSPEQRAILLLWFGSDSVFGWTKQDFALGLERVLHFYPDHRRHVFHRADSSLPDDGSEISVQFAFEPCPIPSDFDFLDPCPDEYHCANDDDLDDLLF